MMVDMENMVKVSKINLKVALNFAILQTHRTYNQQVSLYLIADELDTLSDGESQVAITLVNDTWKTTDCAECKSEIEITDAENADGTELCDSCDWVFNEDQIRASQGDDYKE